MVEATECNLRQPMKPERRGVAWFLLLALLLVSVGFIVSSMLRKLERDQLFLLEENMFKTAQTLAPTVVDVVESGDPGVAKIFDTLQTTQNVTGSRVRLLSAERDLIYDSLSPNPEPQEHLRFRPEIQSAFVGHYGAYTRLSDETGNSLALFVACPVRRDNRVVGCVYVSHSTDEILQQLGVVRRAANRAIFALSLVALIGALLVTGQLRRTLVRLGALTSGVDTVESKDIDLEGTDQVAQIGQNFNRLVHNLRQKVAELEDERNKTHKFLEDVAHELKTPITGLAGSVEALQSGQIDEADRERLLKNVERETERLSELTARLLELQKLEYDQLKVEPFDLISVGETVVDSLEPAALKVGVKLRLEEEFENLVARGDAQKIQRVLENLVDNAVRCSPEGEEVVISHRVEDGNAVVAVLDRGPGPPDKALFARNHQGKRFKGSMGLGLAIASEIMEMHGQELVALPRDGGGSRFQFTLQRVSPDDK